MPVLLITGANRGIGLEFVRQYAAEGWNVIACCRVLETAKALQVLAKSNSAIRIEKLDVSDSDAIKNLAQKLKDVAIDLLINNAGILSGANGFTSALDSDVSQTFGTIDPEAWGKVFRVNTIAPILMIQAFLPLMVRSADRKIVNITSKMGSISEMGGGHDHIAYRTSKAALNAAMRSIASAVNECGISITNIHPGWVKTDMGGKDARLTIEQSVTTMRKTISALKTESSGQFLNYDGSVLPW